MRFLGHHPVASPPTHQRWVTHPVDLLPKFFLATDDYSEAILVILKIPFVIKSKNFYLAECLGLLWSLQKLPFKERAIATPQEPWRLPASPVIHRREM